MNNSRIYVAAAGSGKTHLMLDLAEKEISSLPIGKKIAIVTYTINNQENIKQRLVRDYKVLPERIKVMGWYSFVLNYWIKPFKGDVIPQLYNHHIGLAKVEGTSGLIKTRSGRIFRTTAQSEPRTYFLSPDWNIYTDKLSEMALRCFDDNLILLPKRLSHIFSTIYIDEVQDLATYDLELIRVLAKTRLVRIVMFGDPRQSIISTSKGRKNKGYAGQPNLYIAERINTKHSTFVDIDTTTLSYSHRCIEEICQFANLLIPGYTDTHECKCSKCMERRNSYPYKKGLFLIKENLIEAYVARYNPISLIWSRIYRDKVKTKISYNYGESKGLESDATLVYLTTGLVEYLWNDKIKVSELTKKKFYVAVTRAKYACALVVPDNFQENRFNLPMWEP